MSCLAGHVIALVAAPVQNSETCSRCSSGQPWLMFLECEDPIAEHEGIESVDEQSGLRKTCMLNQCVNLGSYTLTETVGYRSLQLEASCSWTA